MRRFISEHSLYFAWAVALAAMFGSLYFSEVKGIAPCILCWYQRICMYPLVAILAVGILRRDERHAAWYVWPLAFTGAGIGLYQNLLVWGVISEKLAPCTFGVSCVTQEWTALHFITIPLLSLTAFILIIAAMFLHRSRQTHA